MIFIIATASIIVASYFMVMEMRVDFKRAVQAWFSATRAS